MKDRVFVVELNRGFYSAGLYIGILILMIAGIVGAGNLIETMQEIDYVRSQVRCIEAVYYGMSSEIFTYLLPIACTLPMSASWLEDFQSGMQPYIMLKTTKLKYQWSKIINCGLFGGMTVVFSILLLMVVNYIRYPMIDMEFVQWQMIDMTYQLEFLKIGFILSLNGILYAVFGGVISVLTNSRYMAYAAPFIFYYVVSTLVSAYLEDMWMLNPKEWMSAQRGDFSSIIGILLILIIIAVAGYYLITERRWEND